MGGGKNTSTSHDSCICEYNKLPIKNCLKCECFPLKEVLLLKKLENVKHIINYKKICNRNSYKLSLWPGDLDNELVLKIKLK